MKNLYDYLFHYNPYTDEWSAFKREDSNKYFNGEIPEENILKSKNIMTLFGVIKRIKE